MALTVEGNRVEVATPRLRAVFRGTVLTELADGGGRPLLQRRAAAPQPPAGLEVLFADGTPLPLGLSEDAREEVVAVSDNVVHVHVDDVEADACLRISIDEAGRLMLEPSAQSLRRGLGAVRLNLAGIEPGLRLVAPLFQGCRQELDHPLVAGMHCPWPHFWEAGLAILQGAEGGFSVRSLDARPAPKAMLVGHAADGRALGFDTEAAGPWEPSTAVGGLAWTVDVHEGGWEVPARAYREWMREARRLDGLEALRPEWAGEVRLTVQWCPCDGAILEALARVISPGKVLLHVPAWRADPYDENYPEYEASDTGAAFVSEARSRGFRVLPHFNYFAMDPSHPFFRRVRDFVARDVRTRRLMGWRWRGGGRPFPQEPGLLDRMRSDKTMTYIHPGSSTWRRELVRRIAAAARTLELPGVFVDQTLCTFNLEQALVENMTNVEGMLALTRELTELAVPEDGRRLAVAGEGRNEMCMRYETFAQAHLFRSWHTNCGRFEELDPVPFGELLYGDLCRTMGYVGLSGATPESELRMRVHERLGALPSVTVRGAFEIDRPNAAVRRELERATG
jgi:hypothetical protein